MDCILCGSEAERREDNRRFFHCPVCDLIFQERNSLPDWQDEKERYEGHENTAENEGYVKMFKEFIKKAIDPFIENPDKLQVLEFGCGPGPVLAMLLKEKGMEVDLYDPFFYPEKVYLGEKYDLITSTEAFEHFFAPAEEIEKLVDHLKQGGILAVMTKFHENAEQFTDWWYIRDTTHVTFYSKKTFAWIAEKYDLEFLYANERDYVVLKK